MKRLALGWILLVARGAPRFVSWTQPPQSLRPRSRAGSRPSRHHVGDSPTAKPVGPRLPSVWFLRFHAPEPRQSARHIDGPMRATE